VSYAVEKRFSKTPRGISPRRDRGVAGPETANNAVTGTAMNRWLGCIPSIPATAVLSPR